MEARRTACLGSNDLFRAKLKKYKLHSDRRLLVTTRHRNRTVSNSRATTSPSKSILQLYYFETTVATDKPLAKMLRTSPLYAMNDPSPRHECPYHGPWRTGVDAARAGCTERKQRQVCTASSCLIDCSTWDDARCWVVLRCSAVYAFDVSCTVSMMLHHIPCSRQSDLDILKLCVNVCDSPGVYLVHVRTSGRQPRTCGLLSITPQEPVYCTMIGYRPAEWQTCEVNYRDQVLRSVRMWST